MADETPKRLSPDEEALLRLYQRRVQDLRECGVVTQGQVTLKVDFPLGGPVDWDAVPFKGFDRDHFRSAMQISIYFIVQRSLFDLFFGLNLVDSVILYWLDKPDAPIPVLGNITCDDE